MRHIVQQQLPLVEPAIQHEHAAELRRIDRLLAERPEILRLIHADLIRGLRDPKTGRKGKMSAEQAFKALLIKQINGFSYEVLAYHLADSRTYRAFCGFGIGDEVPSKSALQRDIKKLRPETLEAIHLRVLRIAAEKGIEQGRKVRVDCTVVESDIHHPTDSSLLEDGVRVLCRLTGRAKDAFGLTVSDHRRRARKRALGILHAKRNKIRVKLYRDLLKVARKTVSDAGRVADELTRLPVADPIASAVAAGMAAELRHYAPLVRRVIDQTERRVLKGEKVPAGEKLVSLFEPHTDVIVKDRRETHFGHKVVLTGGASGLLTDLVIERGNPADTSLAEKMIVRQERIYGRVPRQAAFDGGFASKENLKQIRALGVADVCFHKKRGLTIGEMARSTWVYKRLRNFRAGIEGMISFLKRCFGLSRCTWRGFASFRAYAWASVLAANLLLMARRLPA
jgi:transposase, IS5 family